MVTKVSQSDVDEIKKIGMEAAVKRYVQGEGSESFREAVRRFYPNLETNKHTKDFVSEQRATNQQTKAKETSKSSIDVPEGSGHSQERVQNLKSQGWTADPTDRAERLYSPDKKRPSTRRSSGEQYGDSSDFRPAVSRRLTNRRNAEEKNNRSSAPVGPGNPGGSRGSGKKLNEIISELLKRKPGGNRGVLGEIGGTPQRSDSRSRKPRGPGNPGGREGTGLSLGANLNKASGYRGDNRGVVPSKKSSSRRRRRGGRSSER